MTTVQFTSPSSNVSHVIPTQLKSLTIWLLWKAVNKPGKSKPDKVAYYASGEVRNGKQGMPKDVASLATFDDAWMAYKAAPFSYAGIGIALLPAMSIGALDLDNCVDANRKLIADHDVKRILKACNKCYIELSPSGRGLRVIGSTSGFNQIAIKGFEAYSKNRFMTVTGKVLWNAKSWGSVDDGVSCMRHLVQGKAVQSSGPVKGAVGKGINLSTHEPDPETPENVQRVRDALKLLNPDMLYPEWVAVLMAIRSTGWDCAEELARKWSEAGEKHSGDAFDKAWGSIEPAGGITLGTLFHKAQEAGWEAPRHVRLSSVLSPGLDEERDVLNGRVFAKHWRGRMLRVNQTGDILAFDPNIGWTEAGDPEIAIRKAARETIAHIQEVGAALLKDGQIDKSQKLTKHAAASSTLQRMDAMAAVGWTHDGMTVSASELDVNPDRLGVRNGVLDLRKRCLMYFCPDDLITKWAGVKFDPEAVAPQFEAFLARVQPDDAVRRLLRQISGLTLWGKPGEQRLFFFLGGGANGKTTFVEALMFALGDYAVSVQAEALMRQDRSSQGPSADTLRLKGARGAFASEVREGRLDEERVKLWTGGDVLTARPMYGRSFIDFSPSHTFIMTGNHRPAIHDTSVGIWRRVTLIDWGVQIPEHEQDARLPERLRLEGSGILNWALYGLADYWENGLAVPPSVKAATEQYRTDEDIIGQFISERCQLGRNLSCPTGEMYVEYRNWAEGNSIRAANKHTFTRRLRDKGYKMDKSRREYDGIAPRRKKPLMQ